MDTIGELIRKNESEYVSGTTKISKYVDYSLYNTLERIDAYHNSKHISGDKDSLGREKPFFNITIASTNVWYRATDIDRSWIKIRATKQKDWLNSFLATIHLQEWMKRERFGTFLNEWGRVLAKYGSAVVKFTEKDGNLGISVTPLNRLIVDAVDFDSNPVIELIELTEAQLRERINTHGYDKDQVEALVDTKKTRELVDGQKKDNKTGYTKLYEIHGVLSESMFTGKDEDKNNFVQQMQVVSYVSKDKEGKNFEDFTLFSGKEEKSPYMITHLIKEDGRTLAMGSVEYLFEPQWMVNHSMKSVKDNLDLSSKIIFQTADNSFVGRNALNNIETGDILVHSPNAPLTQVANNALDVTLVSNYATQWKTLGNEITSVSEAMLGAAPKSGTAWRQTEASLQESHSLFELMTENKGLHIIDMMRERILPHLKKQMDTSKEIVATLEQHDITRIDAKYIKSQSIKETNRQLREKILEGETIEEGEPEALLMENEQAIGDQISEFGNQRFFKPSEISEKTWKEQFKDLEWDVDVDVTGEARNVQEAMTTLSTALKIVTTPGFEQNPKANLIVGKILEMTSVMSPVEYNSLQGAPVPQQPQEGVPNLPMAPGSTGNLPV